RFDPKPWIRLGRHSVPAALASSLLSKSGLVPWQNPPISWPRGLCPGRTSCGTETVCRGGDPMRTLVRCVVPAFLCVLLVPLTAVAQTSAIAGLVKDASGAVLPGVTVEVSSPVLIEKTKTAVTDGGGLYKV